MILPAETKLVFIGDSITDCGRAQPIGEGLFGALGTGYVSLVDAHLQTAYPERNVRVINVGCSGHTVRDLEARWERDVKALQPDWLSVCIGVNDVWRQFDSPLQTEAHVALDVYEETYDRLLAATRSNLKGLILMTPFMVEPHADDPMRRRMDEYGAVVRRLAERYDATFVDLQAAFNAATVHRHPMYFAWDRIHPNLPGSLVIARAFLDSLDFSWSGERAAGS
ncbi:MAG: SGNH/GDSL hydrolase family protein [Fimbriimonas sp.]